MDGALAVWVIDDGELKYGLKTERKGVVWSIPGLILEYHCSRELLL